MNKTKFSIPDFCLFYGLPGIIIFLISLLVAFKTGQDFGNDTFIRSGVFVGMNALQWFIYLTLFIGVCQEISRRKNVSGFPLKSSVENNHLDGIMPIPFLLENKRVEIISVLTETTERNSAIPDTQIKAPIQDIPFEEIDDTDKPLTCCDGSDKIPLDNDNNTSHSSQTISERYQEVLTSYEIKRVVEKRKLVDSIIEYVCETMPPFLSVVSLENLCEEVRKWCENPTYEPKEIELRERLSTNDLCHFIWNIGERLGRSNGYDGECRAKFVKNLFAMTLSDVEVTSLKNMTKTSSSDRIHLDRPDPNDNSFHFSSHKEEKEEISGIETTIYKVA